MKNKRPAISLDDLMWKAVAAGYLHRCRILLKKGADPNAADCVGKSLLHLAAWRGHAKICQLLIDHGANVLAGKLNYELVIPLVLAAEGGHIQACQILLAAGAKHFPIRAPVRDYGDGLVGYAPEDRANIDYFRSVDEARERAAGEARTYLHSPDAYELTQRFEAETAVAVGASRRQGRL